MPLEIRQLLIKSTVESFRDSPAPDEWPLNSLEQLRQDILAECESLLDEKLQQLRER